MGAPAAKTQAASPQRADPQRASLRQGPAASSPTRPAITRLQRAAGNRAVYRMLGGVGQPKLTVGPADDEYEREAERVAQTVMRMPAPPRDDEEDVAAAAP